MAKTTKAAKKEDAEPQQKQRRPFNTNLDKDIVLKAQIKCLTDGVHMSDAIDELLGMWVNGEVEIEFAGANNKH